MLDANIKGQLKAYMEKLQQPIELVAAYDDSKKSQELKQLLEEIEPMSEKISLRTEDSADVRRPSFAINRVGTDIGVRFAGIPMGHEFTSLVLALLQVGGHPSKASQEVIQQIQELDGEFEFETYFSLSCQNCPDVVQAFNLMSVLNPNIKHTSIDGALFQDEVEQREVMAVPSVYLNGQPWGQGRMTLEEVVAKLDTNSAEKEAKKINQKDAFEVLVIGGGPAGSAAAIYAARKGISTGIAAERFGGQVADTMGIENLISVPYTEGPKLVAAMEQHVNEYEVDIMNMQRAEKLIPAAQTGGLHEVKLANGGSLKARTVILSTGARWRQMGVPGEEEYRNKGVAYCPHCDGPLFKGKRVAVIGGGNSGVEAAIDLAGIVGHVTLIEFGEQMRADEVLQKKLRSLNNVKIITSGQTTEVVGKDGKVSGLNYTDRTTGEAHHVELEGVFVQIGLVPNTEWLKGDIELSQHGEIIVNDRNETSIPGVFAAGDATTVPYKQIVISMGEGSKAALSAFDFLIRNSAE
ncbi:MULTISPECIES: alkyl hydroperoxide reductase subunit F [Marinobacter]|jgi:alkyl hydroperoxide reductase subunit F|uniref:Alkyl hydroperoxide reductase subunit F n=2 Tax=Marinobacter TaxID=2742 RepID=A0A137SCA2_9GAMM|nr:MULTISPECIES: alkyl hydroperoxide reductase subunit F [Marinobacter]MDX5442117.1 alkyl hydroperoxide reductase subunit F [Alteromonadaceae bacterium]WBU41252.1 alkyl hydroperoxide reductase subunit F [Marinobacter alkaliphilus]KXO10044.1 Alkyl hydroperoxide reductase protein F [Marinobacter excellens LAMA 842]MCD1631798.1 alkyl hydroperoxide reductase subunit F [Marinobacter shengliensis]MDX5335412.1 alkyl hydroperoxide reductase subunit F [Marinobacter sp.]|tara:strand:+ start:343 stop:1908 length:1566 start_codon:yes stop_codon:yes gene_type:complete